MKLIRTSDSEVKQTVLNSCNSSVVSHGTQQKD